MKKTKGISKKLMIIIPLAALVCAALIFIYLRINPTWKAAELTVEQAGTQHNIQCIDPSGKTLETRVTPPEGFTRVEAGEGSFAQYLRDYPLLPDNSKLPVYDGSTIESEYTAAVFDIDLGDEGYQQCADSVIRLYSDYYYEKGEYDKISFMFSNGDECSYERWRDGKRMLVFGSFSCEIPAAFKDDSEQQYRNYLKEVMNYAGTLSLQKESEKISADDLRIGDIICNDRHVVMVVDMAVNEQGDKRYLFGQSFIPAVCFHIITNTEGDTPTAWYTKEQISRDSFKIGEYSFESKDIRRWKEGF